MFLLRLFESCIWGLMLADYNLTILMGIYGHIYSFQPLRLNVEGKIIFSGCDG